MQIRFVLKSIPMATLAVGLATFAHATASEKDAEQLTSILSIDSGPIQGINNGNLLAWEGIPYAKPPQGEFRWQPPQPVEPWESTYLASHQGDQCVQNADLGVFASPGGSEDCLYLNVYADKQTLRAAQQAGEKLPVFVWIHGGSLWVGESGDYDPRKLASQGEAIVVTINYRLGMFGFFAHPAIGAEGQPYANYGHMDQNFALDWVQRNIETFGGDPQNVTIAGESSGGTSVNAQLISPWSEGKFQQAIMMSGSSLMLRYPNFGAPRPLEEAEEVGENFANAVGCAETEDIAGCLRDLTPGKILANQTPYLINQTIIDGDFMPEHPADAMREGRFNRVTLVNGTTRDEGSFFVAFPENETGNSITPQNYEAALAQFFGGTLSNQIVEHYSLNDYNSPSEAYAAATTDYLFACPSRQLNRWASQWTDIYAYEFADRTAPSYLNPTTFPLGAAHTFELSYLFPGFHGGDLGRTTALNSLQKQLSKEMVGYWTSVANASSWEVWPPYNAEEENVLRMMLPTSSVLEPGQFASDHRCGFWDSAKIY